jgi:hypothetical protein
VKSLINAFCPSLDKSDKTKPNPDAAAAGLKIQSRTVPRRRYEYRTLKYLITKV